MLSALRSVLRVNRSSLIGTAVIVTLAATLLTATGALLEAGLRNEDLSMLVSIASSFAGTVVIIALFIVASVFTGALQPRRREFALLRAVGATAAQVRAAVSAEALVVTLLVTPLGAAIGFVVAPLLVPLLVSGGIVPAGFVLPPSPISALTALIVMAATGLLAARTTARGILRVNPTAAVRQSAVDPTTVSEGRLRTAAGLFVAGLASASAPFFVPGVLGIAAGSLSVILLIIAAGLAGPALVRWAAVRVGRIFGTGPGATRLLAVANARGFSRRLSAAVLPLALLIALGSVQSGVSSAVAAAAANELREGVNAELVIMSPTGITPAQVSALGALPGVTATTATGHVTASVRTDAPDEDLPALDGLSWEHAAIRTISPGESLLDPAVSEGSLRDLEAPGTIAVSHEALLFTGKGVGDTVDLRLNGAETTAQIVAVYERGLGFGDYIISTGEAAELSTSAGFDAVFINASPNAKSGTLQGAADMGLSVTDNKGYAQMATQGAGGEQELSLVLLLALLGFVAAAAASTLATSMRSRRDEFTLLMRLGATRRQVMGMVAFEAAFIIAAALAIGLLAVLPALLAAGQGFFGVPLPVFDVAVTAALAGSAVLITVLTVIPAAWLATSTIRRGLRSRR